LIYMASRYRPEIMRWRYGQQRLDIQRDRMQTLIAAFKARQWRDEHGAWPNTQQFASMMPKESRLEWHTLYDPIPLVNQFRTFHKSPWDYLNYRGSSYARFNPSLVYFNIPPDESTDISDATGIKWGNLKKWYKGIIQAFKPLVESISEIEVQRSKNDDMEIDYGEPDRPETDTIRKNYGKALEVKLHLPKRSFWVIHPGHDGVINGLAQLSDPSDPREIDPYNPIGFGMKGSDDIIQLAGWEN